MDDMEQKLLSSIWPKCIKTDGSGDEGTSVEKDVHILAALCEA